MITTIDRATCKILRDEMSAALQAVATKHGIQIVAKNGTFSSTTMTLKFEASVIGNNGVAETNERRTYKQHAQYFNLKVEWLDQSFQYGTNTYTIVGLNTRKNKRPVLCKKAGDNLTYIFEARLVQMLMEAQPVSTTSPHVADNGSINHLTN